MMFDLSGMTALVTGASGGLGSAIARSQMSATSWLTNQRSLVRRRSAGSVTAFPPIASLLRHPLEPARLPSRTASSSLTSATSR